MCRVKFYDNMGNFTHQIKVVDIGAAKAMARQHSGFAHVVLAGNIIFTSNPLICA